MILQKQKGGKGGTQCSNIRFGNDITQNIKKGRLIKNICLRRRCDQGLGWRGAGGTIKRALRSRRQRLQCSIGNFLQRINYNQLKMPSYPYSFRFITHSLLHWQMNQILLLGHNYHSGKSEERKRWISEELFWEVLGKSEKSDKFVRHFQGQPFRWPHTGQMLLCYLSGAFLLTL